MIDQPDGTGERVAAENAGEAAQRRLDGHAGMGVRRVRAGEAYGDRLIVGLLVEEPRPQLVAGELGQGQRPGRLRDVEAGDTLEVAIGPGHIGPHVTEVLSVDRSTAKADDTAAIELPSHDVRRAIF
jgi:hypothetical protein